MAALLCGFALFIFDRSVHALLFLITTGLKPCRDVETDEKGTRDRYCGFRSFAQACFTRGRNVTQQLATGHGTVAEQSSKKKSLQMGMRVYVARV